MDVVMFDSVDVEDLQFILFKCTPKIRKLS